jgi:methylmalonyl-CoA/ethylmalonyl-CoA epimerase
MDGAVIPFLGSIVEVCIVTSDYKKTMDGLLRLGIGPFQVFDFNSFTVPERSFRGRPGSYELKVCFVKHGSLTFEIMQPVAGDSLMAENLDQVRKSGILGR